MATQLDLFKQLSAAAQGQGTPPTVPLVQETPVPQTQPIQVQAPQQSASPKEALADGIYTATKAVENGVPLEALSPEMYQLYQVGQMTSEDLLNLDSDTANAISEAKLDVFKRQMLEGQASQKTSTEAALDALAALGNGIAGTVAGIGGAIAGAGNAFITASNNAAGLMERRGDRNTNEFNLENITEKDDRYTRAKKQAYNTGDFDFSSVWDAFVDPTVASFNAGNELFGKSLSDQAHQKQKAFIENLQDIGNEYLENKAIEKGINPYRAKAQRYLREFGQAYENANASDMVQLGAGVLGQLLTTGGLGLAAKGGIATSMALNTASEAADLFSSAEEGANKVLDETIRSTPKYKEAVQEFLSIGYTDKAADQAAINSVREEARNTGIAVGAIPTILTGSVGGSVAHKVFNKATDKAVDKANASLFNRSIKNLGGFTKETAKESGSEGIAETFNAISGNVAENVASNQDNNVLRGAGRQGFYGVAGGAAGRASAPAAKIGLGVGYTTANTTASIAKGVADKVKEVREYQNVPKDVKVADKAVQSGTIDTLKEGITRASEINKTNDSAPEVQEEENFKLKEAENILNAYELTDDEKKLYSEEDLIDTNTNREASSKIELINNLARNIKEQSNRKVTSQEEIQNLKQSRANNAIKLLDLYNDMDIGEDTDNIFDSLGDEKLKNRYLAIKNNVTASLQSKDVQAALKIAMQALIENNVSKEDSGIKAKTLLYTAIFNPKGLYDNNGKVVYNAEDISSNMTDEQAHVFNTLTNLYEEAKKSNLLTPEDLSDKGIKNTRQVQDQLLFGQIDFSATDKNKKSALHYLRGLSSAILKNDADKAKINYTRISKLLQNQKNKLEALEKSKLNGGKAVKYDALNSNTGLFMSDRGSIRYESEGLLNRIKDEVSLLDNTVNSLVNVLPNDIKSSVVNTNTTNTTDTTTATNVDVDGNIINDIVEQTIQEESKPQTQKTAEETPVAKQEQKIDTNTTTDTVTTPTKEIKQEEPTTSQKQEQKVSQEQEEKKEEPEKQNIEEVEETTSKEDDGIVYKKSKDTSKKEEEDINTVPEYLQDKPVLSRYYQYYNNIKKPALKSINNIKDSIRRSDNWYNKLRGEGFTIPNPDYTEQVDKNVDTIDQDTSNNEKTTKFNPDKFFTNLEKAINFYSSPSEDGNGNPVYGPYHQRNKERLEKYKKALNLIDSAIKKQYKNNNNPNFNKDLQNIKKYVDFLLNNENDTKLIFANDQSTNENIKKYEEDFKNKQSEQEIVGSGKELASNFDIENIVNNLDESLLVKTNQELIEESEAIEENVEEVQLNIEAPSDIALEKINEIYDKTSEKNKKEYIDDNTDPYFKKSTGLSAFIRKAPSTLVGVADYAIKTLRETFSARKRVNPYNKNNEFLTPLQAISKDLSTLSYKEFIDKYNAPNLSEEDFSKLRQIYNDNSSGSLVRVVKGVLDQSLPSIVENALTKSLKILNTAIKNANELLPEGTEPHPEYTLDQLLNIDKNTSISIGKTTINPMSYLLDSQFGVILNFIEISKKNPDKEVTSIKDLNVSLLPVVKDAVTLGALSWLRDLIDQSGNANKEIVQDTFGVKLNLTDKNDFKTFKQLQKSTSTIIAHEQLMAKISQYLGITSENNAPSALVDGLLSSLSGLVISSLSNYAVPTDSKKPLTILNLNEVNVKTSTINERGEEYSGKKTIRVIRVSSGLKKFFSDALPKGVDKVFLDKSEHAAYSIGDPFKVKTKDNILHSKVPATKEQLAAENTYNKIEYTTNKPFLDLLNRIGERGLIEIANQGDVVEKSELLTEYEKTSRESKVDSMLNGLRAANERIKEIENYKNNKDIEDKNVEDIPIHFNHKIAVNNRIVQTEPYSPLNNKVVRTIFTNLKTVADLSKGAVKNNSFAYRNWRTAIGQAFGINIRKVTYSELNNTVQKVLDNFYNNREIFNMVLGKEPMDYKKLYQFLKDNNIDGEPLHALQALLEYAQWSSMNDTQRKNFTSALAIEIDGSANGSFNIMLKHTHGIIDDKTIILLNEAGYFLYNNLDVRIARKAGIVKEDTYTRASKEFNVGVQNKVQEIFKSDKNNKTSRGFDKKTSATSPERYTATRRTLASLMLLNLFSGLSAKISIEGLDSEEITNFMFSDDKNFKVPEDINITVEASRDFSKNPVMIVSYAAGALSIGLSAFKEIENAIYQCMSNANAYVVITKRELAKQNKGATDKQLRDAYIKGFFSKLDPNMSLEDARVAFDRLEKTLNILNNGRTPFKFTFEKDQAIDFNDDGFQGPIENVAKNIIGEQFKNAIDSTMPESARRMSAVNLNISNFVFSVYDGLRELFIEKQKERNLLLKNSDYQYSLRNSLSIEQLQNIDSNAMLSKINSVYTLENGVQIDASKVDRNLGTQGTTVSAVEPGTTRKGDAVSVSYTSSLYKMYNNYVAILALSIQATGDGAMQQSAWLKHPNMQAQNYYDGIVGNINSLQDVSLAINEAIQDTSDISIFDTQVQKLIQALGYISIPQVVDSIVEGEYYRYSYSNQKEVLSAKDKKILSSAYTLRTIKTLLDPLGISLSKEQQELLKEASALYSYTLRKSNLNTNNLGKYDKDTKNLYDRYDEKALDKFKNLSETLIDNIIEEISIMQGSSWATQEAFKDAPKNINHLAGDIPAKIRNNNEDLPEYDGNNFMSEGDVAAVINLTISTNLDSNIEASRKANIDSINLARETKLNENTLPDYEEKVRKVQAKENLKKIRKDKEALANMSEVDRKLSENSIISYNTTNEEEKKNNKNIINNITNQISNIKDKFKGIISDISNVRIAFGSRDNIQSFFGSDYKISDKAKAFYIPSSDTVLLDSDRYNIDPENPQYRNAESDLAHELVHASLAHKIKYLAKTYITQKFNRNTKQNPTKLAYFNLKNYVQDFLKMSDKELEDLTKAAFEGETEVDYQRALSEITNFKALIKKLNDENNSLRESTKGTDNREAFYEKNLELINEFFTHIITNDTLSRIMAKKNMKNTLKEYFNDGMVSYEDVYDSIKTLLFGTTEVNEINALDYIKFNVAIISNLEQFTKNYSNSISTSNVVYNSISLQDDILDPDDKFNYRYNKILSLIDNNIIKPITKANLDRISNKATYIREKIKEAKSLNSITYSPLISNIKNAIGLSGITLDPKQIYLLSAIAGSMSLMVNATTNRSNINTVKTKNTDALLELYKLKENVLEQLKDSKDPSEIKMYEAINNIDKYVGNVKDSFDRGVSLSAFVGLMAVHPEYRNILSKLKVKDYTGDTYIEEFINRGINKINEMLSINNNNNNALANMDKYLELLLTTKDTSNLIDKVNHIYDRLDHLSTITDRAANAAYIKLSNKSFKMSNLLTMGISLFNNNNRGILYEASQKQLNKVNMPYELRTLIRDLIGTSKKSLFINKHVKQIKQNVLRKRQELQSKFKESLKNEFKTKLNSKQEEILTKVIVKADLASLNNTYNLASLKSFLSNENNLNTEIKKVESEFKDYNPTYASKIKQLAQFMVTGEPGKFLLRNAHAIVAKLNPKVPIKDLDQNTIDIVNKLVSLYAIKYSDKKDLMEISNLITKDEDAMQRLISSYRLQINKELENIRSYPNALYNYYKGHVFNIKPANNTNHIIIANDINQSSLAKRGYTKIDNFSGSSLDSNKAKRSYYMTSTSFIPKFNQGALMYIRPSILGVDAITGMSKDNSSYIINDTDTIKNYLAKYSYEKDNNLSPIFNEEGKVIGLEYLMPLNIKEKLQLNNNIFDVYADWAGRKFEETSAMTFNKELIDGIAEQYKKDVSLNSDEYINILDKDSIPKYFGRSVKLINTELLDYIKKAYGDNKFYVKRNDLRDVLGQYSLSVTDLLTNNAKWNKAVVDAVNRTVYTLLGKDALVKLKKGETILQNTVSSVKDIIVVKSGIVPAVNILSNVYQLVYRGVSPTTIIKEVPKKVKELNFYNRASLKLLELEGTKQILNPKNNKDRAKIAKINNQINSIKEALGRLSISPILDMGELSTIADIDLNNDDVDILSGKFSEALDRAVDKLPPMSRTIGKNILITRDTDLYKILQKTVQYGDFVAKSILYDYLIEKKKYQKEDAEYMVLNEYVNYDLLNGRYRDYLESIGLAWFLNYALRSTRVGLNMIVSNPIKAVLYSLLPNIIPGIDSIGTAMSDNVIGRLFEGTIGNSFGIGTGIRGLELIPAVNLVTD